nr:SLC13 family permease [Morganella morganii]
MLTLIGLLIIISIVVLLMTGKTSPVIAMSVIPLLGALLAGYSLPEITEFFDYGIRKVASVAVMFLFAILFFSIMKDLHIFNPFIRLMIGLTRGNVVIVAMVTALVAAVVHLDGSGRQPF